MLIDSSQIDCRGKRETQESITIIENIAFMSQRLQHSYA